MQEGNKLKKDFSYHMIKGLLTKLEKEGIEAVYLSLKNAKISPGSSLYTAALNDILVNRPNAKEWKYPKVRESFEFDVRYYCEYYLGYYEE